MAHRWMSHRKDLTTNQSMWDGPRKRDGDEKKKLSYWERSSRHRPWMQMGNRMEGSQYKRERQKPEWQKPEWQKPEWQKPERRRPQAIHYTTQPKESRPLRAKEQSSKRQHDRPRTPRDFPKPKTERLDPRDDISNKIKGPDNTSFPAAVERLILVLMQKTFHAAYFVEYLEQFIQLPVTRQRLDNADWEDVGASFTSMLRLMAECSSQFNPSQILSCVNALKIFHFIQAPLPVEVEEDLFSTVEVLCKETTEQPCSSQLTVEIIKCLGLLQFPRGELYAALLQNHMFTRSSFELTGSDYSAILRSMTSARSVSARVLQKLAEKIVLCHWQSALEPVDVARIVWGYAKMNVKDDNLMATLANHVAQDTVICNCNSQDIANIAWAYAALGVTNQKLFDAIAKEMLQDDELMKFKPQGIVNVLWAFATLDINNEPFFMAVADHIVRCRLFLQFNPQDIGNTAWSFGHLQICHTTLMSVLAGLLLNPRKLATFSPQNIANTLWGFARVGLLAEEMMNSVSAYLLNPKVLGDFPCQPLANLVWAFGTLGYGNVELMLAIAQHCTQPVMLQSFNHQEMVNVLWAFGSLRICSVQLFESFAARLVQPDALEKMPPQALSNLVWSFALLDIRPSDLLSAIIEHITHPNILQPYDAQSVANLAWALATLDIVDDNACSVVLRRLALFPLEEEHPAEFFNSVHQFLIHVQQYATTLPISAQLLQTMGELANKCRAAFIAISETSGPSNFHMAVLDTFSQMGLPLKSEAILHDAGGYSVDLLDEKTRLVIEVDGPAHFSKTSGVPRPLGAMLMKHRHIRTVGYRLVSVPYFEWNALGNIQQRKNYLENLLSKQTSPAVPHSDAKQPVMPMVCSPNLPSDAL